MVRARYILLLLYIAIAIYIGFFKIDKETFGIGVQCGDLCLLSIILISVDKKDKIIPFIIGIVILTTFKLVDIFQYKLTISGADHYNDIYLILATFIISGVIVFRRYYK